MRIGIIGWVFGMAENYRLCGAVNSSQCFEGYVCIRQPPQLGYCATQDMPRWHLATCNTDWSECGRYSLTADGMSSIRLSGHEMKQFRG